MRRAVRQWQKQKRLAGVMMAHGWAARPKSAPKEAGPMFDVPPSRLADDRFGVPAPAGSGRDGEPR